MDRIYALILLVLPFFLFAEDKKFGVMAHIEDAFTHEQIEGQVTISINDSIIADISTYDSGECYLPLNGRPGSRFKCLATAEGYESDSAEFVIPNSRVERINHVFLLNKMRKHDLNEVTVTSTVIKMVMHNDTIIYNADAFELSSGSMLDALVNQLPGVELKNGVIKVQGRYVSSLLLNGEDFFSGDPSIALRNLPAFMIKSVKVYNKESDHAYLTGTKAQDEKPLVMDINLKREYSIGWVANVDGGFGMPDKRYQGRGFGMFISDNLRAVAFVNANNINDSSTAGSKGAWSGSSAVSGDNEIINGGLDFLFNNSAKTAKINGNIVVSRDKNELLSETSQCLFFTSGDVWKQQREKFVGRQFGVDTQHSIHIQRRQYYCTISPYFSYKSGKSNVMSNSLTLNPNPGDTHRRLSSLDSVLNGDVTESLKARIDNFYRRMSIGISRYLAAGFNADTYISVPNTPDLLSVELSGQYVKQWYENEIAYSIDYPGGNGNSANRQRNPYSSPSYSIGSNVNYKFNFPENKHGGRFNIMLTAKYAFNHNKAKDEWFLIEEQVSNHARMIKDFDPINSYRRNERVYTPCLKAEFDYKLMKFSPSSMSNTTYQFKASVEDYAEFSRIDNFSITEEHQRRNSNFILPSVTFNYAAMRPNDRNILTATYNWTQREAPLTYLLNYHYNSDPLNHYLSNTDLSRTGTHSVNINYTYFNNKHKRQVGVNVMWQLLQNALVNARFYDSKTGISTWQPMNINGNWNIRTELQYSQPLDANRMFELSSFTTYVFDNNVDFSSTSGVPLESRVRNNILAERLRVNWQYAGYSVSVGINAQWHNATSGSVGFQTINLRDIQPTISAIVPLPWKLELTTDFTTTIRRGYSDSSINKTFALWNASITKALFDDNLTIKIRAYDILGQIQPLTSTVNAQAITEVYRTTLRRYVMLSVLYRLNIQPKKH